MEEYRLLYSDFGLAEINPPMINQSTNPLCALPL